LPFAAYLLGFYIVSTTAEGRAAVGACGQRIWTEFIQHDAPTAAACRQYRSEGMMNFEFVIVEFVNGIDHNAVTPAYCRAAVWDADW